MLLPLLPGELRAFENQFLFESTPRRSCCLPRTLITFGNDDGSIDRTRVRGTCALQNGVLTTRRDASRARSNGGASSSRTSFRQTRCVRSLSASGPSVTPALCTRSRSRVSPGKCMLCILLFYPPHLQPTLRYYLPRILNGFDNDGRPILYMFPGRENTDPSPRQVRHLVWCLYVSLPSTIRQKGKFTGTCTENAPRI